MFIELCSVDNTLHLININCIAYVRLSRIYDGCIEIWMSSDNTFEIGGIGRTHKCLFVKMNLIDFRKMLQENLTVITINDKV